MRLDVLRFLLSELELVAKVEDDFALAVAEGGGDGAEVTVGVTLESGEVGLEAVFQDAEDVVGDVLAEDAAVAASLSDAVFGGHGLFGVFESLSALVGGLCELELEGGGLGFFSFLANGLNFCGSVVDFGGGTGGIEGIADEFIGIDDIEAGGIAGELGVIADGSESVVEA